MELGHGSVGEVEFAV